MCYSIECKAILKMGPISLGFFSIRYTSGLKIFLHKKILFFFMEMCPFTSHFRLTGISESKDSEFLHVFGITLTDRFLMEYKTAWPSNFI